MAKAVAFHTLDHMQGPFHLESTHGTTPQEDTQIPPEIQPELPRGTMTIERIAYGGDGVGSLDGMVVFVPQTAPGDVVDVQLVSQRRRYAVGTVTALRQPSWRVRPLPAVRTLWWLPYAASGLYPSASDQTAQVQSVCNASANSPMSS